MKIYKDFAKTQEIEEKESLDFGVVLLGENKDITFYVMNDSKAALVDLVFTLISVNNDKQVKIISAPKILLSGQTDKLVFNYTPHLILEKLNVSLGIEAAYLI